MGCLSLSKKKIQKFRFKVKWNSNFPKNPFGNCRLSPEVVLFFRLERSGGNFINSCFIFQFLISHQPETIMRNWIANGKLHLGQLICWFWKNPYHYSMVNPTSFFWQTVSTHVLIAFDAPDKEGSHIGSISMLKFWKQLILQSFSTLTLVNKCIVTFKKISYECNKMYRN